MSCLLATSMFFAAGCDKDKDDPRSCDFANRALLTMHRLQYLFR